MMFNLANLMTLKWTATPLFPISYFLFPPNILQSTENHFNSFKQKRDFQSKNNSIKIMGVSLFFFYCFLVSPNEIIHIWIPPLLFFTYKKLLFR